MGGAVRVDVLYELLWRYNVPWPLHLSLSLVTRISDAVEPGRYRAGIIMQARRPKKTTNAGTRSKDRDHLPASTSRHPYCVRHPRHPDPISCIDLCLHQKLRPLRALLYTPTLSAAHFHPGILDWDFTIPPISAPLIQYPGPYLQFLRPPDLSSPTVDKCIKLTPTSIWLSSPTFSGT